jgi:pimeloyl-ACP methyl ester carboxylesterase
LSTIVLVHGIAQEHRSADDLEAEWLPALAGGLRLAGYPDLADRIWRDRAPGGLEARMAFYGDCFRQPGRMGGADVQLTGEQAALAEDLAREWLERAAADASSPRERAEAASELARVCEPPGQTQGSGAVQRNVIAALARVRWFAPFGMSLAERFVWRALAQVTSYLTDERVRARAISQVERLLSSDTRVLIGHSLGSVVAYETAHRMQRPLPLLITLGSPLGLRTIVYERLRPQPPCFPASVARWVNVADRDDFIAAAPDLGGIFAGGQPAGSVFESGWTVDNGAKPHLATFYLTSCQVAEPVGQVLAA